MVNARIYALFLLAFAAMAFVVWQQGKELHKAKVTTEGVTSIIQPGTVTHIGPTGESVTSQTQATVSKVTFNDLKGEQIKALESKFDTRFGKVEGMIEAAMTTTNKPIIVPVHDTVWKHDTIHEPAKVIRWSGRFESGTVIVGKDSARVQTSVVNKLAILQTRDRWKLKHLWPGNWGKRKNRVQLLVFNPNTHVDTLSNLSVIQ